MIQRSSHFARSGLRWVPEAKSVTGQAPGCRCKEEEEVLAISRSFLSQHELDWEFRSSETIANYPAGLLIPYAVVEDIAQLDCPILYYFHWWMSLVLLSYSGLEMVRPQSRVFCLELWHPSEPGGCMFNLSTD